MANPPNPKEAQGAAKIPLRYIPPAAILELGRAMRDGVRPRTGLPDGYGPFNWRVSPVEAMTYLEAMERHRMLYMEGEARDPVSKAMHLGHVMACCAIVIDSTYFGNLIDNRPPGNPEVIRQLGQFDEQAPDWTKGPS